MRVTAVLSAVALLLCEFSSASAKAIILMPRGINSNHLNDMMTREARTLHKSLHRRQTLSTPSTISPSSSGDVNATISAACTSSLSSITTITNAAGMSACYNILQHDVVKGTFQADLRLYQTQAPSGDFTGLSSGDMLVNLVYPSSTSFSLLTKRSLQRRQSADTSMLELQQYSLSGSLATTISAAKLNNTSLLSLMTPVIRIDAVQRGTQKPIVANVSASDTAFFVIGDFQQDFSEQIVNPKFQAQAIAQSSAFVLPGTTFGIFPVGMIVTLSWLVIFVVAYGAGTLGRIQHRKAYRTRKAAMGGRTGMKI